MLPALRTSTGHPNLRVRLAALAVVLLLVLATAPLVVLPLYAGLVHGLSGLLPGF